MKKEKLFWGLFLIIAAIFMLVSQFGMFKDISVFSILFTILLVAMLINGLKDINWTEIFFSIALICILYSNQLGINAITPWPVLCAALLLSIGFSMIFSKRKHIHFESHIDDEFDDIENASGSEINFETNFGGSAKYINSEDFRKANVNCSFGAVKLYLDNAEILDTATINLNVNFGGVEIFVPRKYRVENNLRCSLAGVEEKNFPGVGATKTLVLRGKLSFAGVTIIYI